MWIAIGFHGFSLAARKILQIAENWKFPVMARLSLYLNIQSEEGPDSTRGTRKNPGDFTDSS